MAKIKALFDKYGIIHEAEKVLPDKKHRVKFLEALAELEDNSCHINRSFPKTRLHKIKGYKQAVYRADIDKTSGWRFHIQYHKKTYELHLKDVVNGQLHDDTIKVIKSKKDRYE
jgi:hypothetical protein